MLDLKKPIEEILKELILTPSESYNEKNICDKIFSSLSKLNIKNIKRVDNNLVIKLSNFRNKKNIALVGHLDTVKVDSKEQFIPKVIKGSIYGRGSVDMKAGLACMLKIAYEIITGKIKPKYNVSLVFYSNEEVALPNGINKLIDQKLLNNIDLCFVLEPTNGEYAVGCLGSVSALIRIKGKAAHSALPNEGINAIYESLDVLKKISCFGEKPVKIMPGCLAKEVMSITQINTQNPGNVVPNECVLNLNYRFSPKKTIKMAKKEVIKLAGKDIDFTDLSPSCMAPPSINKFLLPKIPRKLFNAWSDIAQLNSFKIPAINFGPGSLLLAHKPEEHIKISDLKKFYLSLIKHF